MTATLAGMDSKTLITLSRSIDAVCGIAVIVAFYDMGVKACKGHGNRLRKDMA